MAEYKEIKGFQVQTRSEDPTPYAQALADNPYAGTWASGGDLNTGRRFLNTAAGSGSDSGLIAGGYTGSNVANVEQYNGTAWTEKNDLNAARRSMSTTGSVTAAITVGGVPPASDLTETWNGSSWTEVNELNTARGNGTVVGTTTAALFGAGYSTTNVANVESWNGSSWTETGDVNTARSELAASGTSTQSLVIGGYTTTAVGGGKAHSSVLA